MNLAKEAYRNRVLAALPKAELARLQPHLSLVNLNQEQTLLDGTAPYAYFLETGIASVVVTTEGGSTAEVGIIGMDGVVGIPILLGADTAPGGRSFRLPVPVIASRRRLSKTNSSVPGSCDVTYTGTCKASWCSRHKRQPATGCTI